MDERRNIQNNDRGESYQVNQPTAPVFQGGDHNQNIVNYGIATIHLLPISPNPKKYNAIPYTPSKNFVGRIDELKRIDEILQTSEGAVISAVAGMGGLGKTELAVKYATDHKQDYPGGVCWLNARERDIATQIIEKLVLWLGLEVPQEVRGRLLPLEEQVAWCWERWQPDGRVLVVLDDVTDWGACEPFVPTDERFRLLLTTREQDIARQFECVPLDVLKPEQARELLGRLEKLGRVAQDQQMAGKLCEALGYLPLGIELVGRYLLTNRSLSLTQVWERLQANGVKDPALERSSNYAMTAKLGMQAAFNLTWAQLDGDARRVARLLSYFALDDIPWELAEWMMQRVQGEDYSIQVAQTVLDNCSLVQVEDEKLWGCRLHPLIREFLREQEAEAVRETDDRSLREAFVSELVDVAKQVPQTLTKEWIEPLTLVHLHLQEVAERFSAAVEDQDLLWAFVGLARFYEGQGLYAQAEPWYEKCLEVTQTRLGENHPDVAISLNNLAELYKAQGRYSEAEPLHLQALDIQQRQLGKEHPDVALSLHNVAALYYWQGRYTEAEPLYRQALDIQQQQLGKDHPDVAQSLNNLATLYRAQGRYSEAEPLYLQALDIRQQQLGKDHPDVAQSLNNLALLYRTQGRYSEAESLYLQALDIQQQQLGKDHPDVAQSLNNLADLYQAQGRYSEAELLHLQALDIRQRQLGQDHPDVAQSLNNLAGLYYWQGRYTEAEPLLARSLLIREQKLGQNHSHVAQGLNNLAEIYRLQGRYREAESRFLQALNIMQQQLGQNHPDVAISLNNLAHLYKFQGRYSEAESLMTEALAICENVLGIAHPNTMTVRQNLANLLHEMSRPR